jgi:hypothetical protein
MAKETNKGSAAAGIGIGVAALAAAAAGAYYFYGTNAAAQHRKQMKGWMIKAKGDVVEKLENLKDLSQENYDNVVKQVTEKYGKLKNVNPQDLKAMADDMRKHWKNISGQLKKAPVQKKAGIKKPVKK